MRGAGNLADRALQADNEEPSSSNEKYMAKLWREAIGLEQILLPQKFLDVGGNSLTLNIILKRINDEKGVLLEPKLFFDPETSSLFQLARELDVSLESKPNRPQ